MTENKIKKQVENELVVKGYSESTAQVYSQSISDLAKFYSTNNPLELTSDDITRYLEHQGKIFKRKANTIKSMHSAFILYYNKLHRKNLQLDYKKMANKDRNIEIPSMDHIRMLFDSTANLKGKALMGLVYGCGLEMGELINLKYEDIDSDRNIILVKSNRKKDSRETYISSNLISLINDYYKAFKPKTWLFESKILGEQSSPKTIQYHIKNAAQKAGLTCNMNLLILKYCYVKHSEELGIPLSTILKRLGVTHRSSFRFYASLGVKDNDKLYVSPFDKL